DALALIEQSARTARFPSPERIRTAIRNLYATKGGYPHEQVDAAGYRVFAAVGEKIAETASHLTDESQVTYTRGMSKETGAKKPLEGYRWPVSSGNKVLDLTLRSGEPAVVTAGLHLYVFVPVDSGPGDEIEIASDDAFGEVLRIPMRDAIP